MSQESIAELFGLSGRLAEVRWLLGPRRLALFTANVEVIADALTQHPASAYITINELHPDTPTRHDAPVDRIFVPRRGQLTADADITRRLLLPFDSDPVRPTNVAATIEQRQLAFQQSEQIEHALCGLGWPEPALVSSGNGAARYFACDLPADPETDELVCSFYSCCAKKFSTPQVKLDTSISNAARIMRLPGSTNTKAGRLCELLHLPDTWQQNPVTLPLLRTVTEQWRAETNLSSTQSRGDGIARPEAQAKFVRRFVKYAERIGAIFTVLPPLADGKVLILTSPCLLHGDHDGGVGITMDGLRCIQCFHNRCKSLGWAKWSRAVEAKHGPMQLDGGKLIFSKRRTNQ